MNLLRFLKRSHAPRSNTPTPRALSASIQDWLAGVDIPTNTSTPLINAYEQIPWIYRCVNVLAEQVANIPFVFSHGQRGRETLITSGPLVNFYDRPHPQLNRFQYWELRVIWLMLRGECFSEQQRRFSGQRRTATAINSRTMCCTKK